MIPPGTGSTAGTAVLHNSWVGGGREVAQLRCTTCVAMGPERERHFPSALDYLNFFKYMLLL